MAKHLMMQTRKNEPKVLGSWKEIAAYLGKGVRTVQRWENDLGLPVRRPNGAAKGVVYASPDELERWLAHRWGKRTAPLAGNGPLNEAMRASRELRHANQVLVDELMRNLEALRRQCTALAQATNEAKQAREKFLTRRRGRR
jgi:hypothetical protein